MMDSHTLSIAGFVSQATFALTFSLLAWSDRRTKGMAWLAAAAVLELLITGSRALHSPNIAVEDCVGSLVILLQFSFAYMGLRWFAVRRELRSRSAPAALAVAACIIVVLAAYNPVAALLAGRLVALVIISVTVRMVWSSRLIALRTPLRVTAFLLAFLGAVLALRLAIATAPRYATAVGVNDGSHLSDWLRVATIITITPLLLSVLALFAAETNRRLHDETRVDVLTGLRNRRALEETATLEARQCSATNVPLALLMMDLDHFKQLNDTWGHGLGDRALRAMGSVLLTVIGEEAVSARMGGEEFAVLLPGYDLHAATAVAERVRASVEDIRLAEGDKLAHFTVSVGVSVMQPGERAWTDMMGRADDALYQAKREGRNRVAISASEQAGSPRARAGKRPSWKQLLLPRQGPML